MQSLTLARNAMATRFELVLRGSNPISLRAAGEEALDEITSVEAQLSVYRSSSEIARVNSHAAEKPVRVSAPVFALLQQALKLTAETQGTFDVSVGPLLQCWGFREGAARIPTVEELETARAAVGMQNVRLDPEISSVSFARPGVGLDLGAIGKGYALDRAASLLREAGVTSALLHGGTSTVIGIGTAGDGFPWKIAVDLVPPETPPGAERPPPVLVKLRDQALSVSAVWGKSFRIGNRLFGHVIDPRSGYPVAAGLLAAVVSATGAESDALSTALLAWGTAGHDRLFQLRPGLQTLYCRGSNGEDAGAVETRGL